MTKVSGLFLYNGFHFVGETSERQGIILKKQEIVLWLVGGIISFLPIMGETPMVLSFFASSFMAGTGRMVVSLLLGLILIGKGLTLEGIRYLTIGMTFGFIWKIQEARGRREKRWLGSIYMGAIYLFVALSGQLLTYSSLYEKLYVVFQSIFITGVSLILNKISTAETRVEREIACQLEGMQPPGKEKMLESSRALRRLSRSLFGIADYRVAGTYEDSVVSMDVREAVGAQLLEMSDYISDMAEDIFGKQLLEEELMDRLKEGILAMKIQWVEGKGYVDNQGSPELFLCLRGKRGEVVSVREVEKKVSQILHRKMTAVRDGRRVVNQQTVMLHFLPKISYKYLYGVAKSVKENEVISGDNFTFTVRDNGELLMGISDGMGSGIQANKDSEEVMELMEQFFEAGFPRKTALNLINSTWMGKGMEPGAATLDLCTLDLHQGTYEILKQGAATTFILENNQVKMIRGQDLPMGLCVRGGFSAFHGELGKEAYIIMVSDGVLDAFWQEDGELAVEDLLLYEKQNNPKLLANAILEEALIASNGRARDDMTVLVLGLWKQE